MATGPTVNELAALLADANRAERPDEFPSDLEAANQPGLYAWRVDSTGLEMFNAAFDVDLPSLIYAGQAGATSDAVKKERTATLRSRIVGNHLGGNIS